MQFRLATRADIAPIANLHADSWRNSYRGMLSDHFLDHKVVTDRYAVWQQRLGVPAYGQYVLVAEEGPTLCGFICLICEATSKYGILLDNLHIRHDMQGRGLGKQLMLHASTWIAESVPSKQLHLWVFANNTGAIRFYKRLGAREAGSKMEDSFGEQPVLSLRYVWDDVTTLVEQLRLTIE